jgi:hypothetical protein
MSSTDLDVALGTRSALFVEGGTSWERLNDVHRRANAYSADVGWQLNFSSMPIQLCPIIGYARQRGPNDVGEFHLDFRSQSAAAGLALGAAVYQGASIEVIPAIAFQFTRSWLDIVPSYYCCPVETKSTDHSQALLLTTGLQLERMVTLQPAVAIPIAVKGASSIFSFGLAVNLFDE